jgi:hypothetical protein
MRIAEEPSIDLQKLASRYAFPLERLRTSRFIAGGPAMPSLTVMPEGCRVHDRLIAARR